MKKNRKIMLRNKEIMRQSMRPDNLGTRIDKGMKFLEPLTVAIPSRSSPKKVLLAMGYIRSNRGYRRSKAEGSRFSYHAICHGNTVMLHQDKSYQKRDGRKGHQATLIGCLGERKRILNMEEAMHRASCMGKSDPSVGFGKRKSRKQARKDMLPLSEQRRLAASLRQSIDISKKAQENRKKAGIISRIAKSFLSSWKQQ